MSEGLSTQKLSINLGCPQLHLWIQWASSKLRRWWIWTCSWDVKNWSTSFYLGTLDTLASYCRRCNFLFCGNCEETEVVLFPARNCVSLMHRFCWKQQELLWLQSQHFIVYSLIWSKLNSIYNLVHEPAVCNSILQSTCSMGDSIFLDMCVSDQIGFSSDSLV